MLSDNCLIIYEPDMEHDIPQLVCQESALTNRVELKAHDPDLPYVGLIRPTLVTEW